MRKWLVDERIKRKLTLKQMGEILGIAESYYSIIEKAERKKNLSLPLAVGISAALDIPLDEIAYLEIKEGHMKETIKALRKAPGISQARHGIMPAHDGASTPEPGEDAQGDIANGASAHVRRLTTIREVSDGDADSGYKIHNLSEKGRAT